MVRSLRRAGQGRRGATLCLLVAAGLVGAACSSDAEVSVPSVELSTTTVTTLPPTTEAPSTTEAPTTTVDPRIAEVEAAVAEFRRVQVETLTNPQADSSALSEVATGELLASNIDFVQQQRAEGTTIAGYFEQTVVEVEVVSDTEAILVGCGLDALAAVDANGREVDAPDLDALLRKYDLVRSSPSADWLVSRVQYPGSELQPCDP